jgi:predicted RNase H-like HicB family nuclease
MNSRYTVIYEPTSTGYSAYSPDVPGCIATGVTLAATRDRMTEALAVHLNSMREDGDALPVPGCVVEVLEIAA